MPAKDLTQGARLAALSDVQTPPASVSAIQYALSCPTERAKFFRRIPRERFYRIFSQGLGAQLQARIRTGDICVSTARSFGMRRASGATRIRIRLGYPLLTSCHKRDVGYDYRQLTGGSGSGAKVGPSRGALVQSAAVSATRRRATAAGRASRPYFLRHGPFLTANAQIRRLVT
jgi:hypothetical protein